MDEFAGILLDVLKTETSEIKLIEKLKLKNSKFSTSYIRQSLKKVEEFGLVSSFKRRSGQTYWNLADDNIIEDSEPSSDNVVQSTEPSSDNVVQTGPFQNLQMSENEKSDRGLKKSLSSSFENTCLHRHSNSSVSGGQSLSQNFDPDETPIKEKASSSYPSAVPQTSRDSRRHGESRATDKDETALKERARRYGDSCSSQCEIERLDGNKTTVRAGDFTVQTTAPVSESRARNMEPDLQEYYNYLQKIINVLQKSNTSLAGKDVAQKSGLGKAKSDVNKVLYFLEKRNIVEKEKSGKPLWNIPEGKVLTEDGITQLAAEWKAEVLKCPPKKQASADSGGGRMELAVPCSRSALVPSQMVRQYEEHMNKILDLFRSSAVIAPPEVVLLCEVGSKRSASSYLYFLQNHGLICKDGDSHWKLSDSCPQQIDTRRLAIEMAEAETQHKHRAGEDSGDDHGNNIIINNHYHQHNYKVENNYFVQIGSDNTMSTLDSSSSAVTNTESTQS